MRVKLYVAEPRTLQRRVERQLGHEIKKWILRSFPLARRSFYTRLVGAALLNVDWQGVVSALLSIAPPETFQPFSNERTKHRTLTGRKTEAHGSRA
jgi:hypothetical protein